MPQGAGRRPIVLDDSDRLSYVRRFARISRELDWLTHASCLMDTHHHAVIETPEPNLGEGMKRLLGGHARYLNVRHDREETVFRPHYWSKRIFDDGWLLRACLYAVLNPVTGGMCRHPRDWPWCSYRRTAYGDPDAYAPGEERLLGLFGGRPLEARNRYANAVDESVEVVLSQRVSDTESLWGVLEELHC